MKCPFRKSKMALAGHNTGMGYPAEWTTREEFEECIKEKCAAYYLKQRYYPKTEEDACALCTKE